MIFVFGLSIQARSFPEFLKFLYFKIPKNSWLFEEWKLNKKRVDKEKLSKVEVEEHPEKPEHHNVSEADDGDPSRARELGESIQLLAEVNAEHQSSPPGRAPSSSWSS